MSLRLLPYHPKPQITRALLKKAVRLFRSALVPRAIRRANARQWLQKMEQLGDRHVYKGGDVKWGARQRPGSK